MRLFLIVLLSAATFSAAAQDRRPVPYPVLYDAKFQDALDAETRSETGEPGAAYWQNSAEYKLQARLSPASGRLEGSATLRYHNNSPDALPMVLVHLRQNMHADGVVRNRSLDVTGGVTLGAVSVDGVPQLEAADARSIGYSVSGTLMRIRLVEPIGPGETRDFAIDWSYSVPPMGSSRNGTDGDVYYMAYWYPQFAVYDDVNGWKADPYMGNGEFYMGYGSYDVSLTVPHGWLVAATGDLVNPEEVLSDQTLYRLEMARLNPSGVVRVVDEEDREAGTSTLFSDSGALTWRFQADNVRDFAWGASANYLWDSALASVGDTDGDGTSETSRIHAFWRPEAATWARSAEFAKYSIEYLSETFFPYPYPHMTTVEGIIGGGMEYPMITLIGSNRNDRSLFGVTFHEIAHMYFPMLVGSDEKDNTWMDEGLTSFNTTEASIPFWNDPDGWNPQRQSYYYIAGSADERPSRRHADRYPLGTSARGIASYNKPAVGLHALRGLLGNDLFYEAFQEYARRWTYKHPQPYDLFNTFENVTGQDLDWFWTTHFYETWTLDQAVDSVVEGEEGVQVHVKDLGVSPFPVPIRVTYADGTVVEEMLSVDGWLDGQTRERVATFERGTVERVEIDSEQFLPDVDRSNNVWTR